MTSFQSILSQDNHITSNLKLVEIDDKRVDCDDRHRHLRHKGRLSTTKLSKMKNQNIKMNQDGSLNLKTQAQSNADMKTKTHLEGNFVGLFDRDFSHTPRVRHNLSMNKRCNKEN